MYVHISTFHISTFPHFHISIQKTKLLEQNITNLQSAEFYFKTRLSKLEQDVHDCTTIVNKPKRKPGRPRKSKAIVHELGN